MSLLDPWTFCGALGATSMPVTVKGMRSKPRSDGKSLSARVVLRTDLIRTGALFSEDFLRCVGGIAARPARYRGRFVRNVRGEVAP
jgi:hypothetical protein